MSIPLHELELVTQGVHLFRNRTFPSNTYVLEGFEQGRCIVVDPGLDGDNLVEILLAESLTPAAVLCTHGHFDHIAGARALQQEFELPVYMHGSDLPIARSSSFTMMLIGVTGKMELPDFDRDLATESEVSVIGLRVEFLHTPGHTPGSGVLLAGNLALTGDTLFRDAIGRNRLPGEDQDALACSLTSLSHELRDDTYVLPGHGRPGRFGEIKATNQDFRDLTGLAAARSERQ